MSDAENGNITKITGADEFIALFLKGNKTCKAGIELELTFLKHDHAGRLVPIDEADNKILQDVLKEPSKYGYSFTPVLVSEEAATMTLEVKTGAANLDNFELILDDLSKQINTINQVCFDLEFLICPFAQAPHIKSSELLNHYIVSRESGRAEAFINTFELHGLQEYYTNFFLNNAIQTSVSFRDPKHLLDNIRRLTYLTAPLSNIHDNSCGFIEGNLDRKQTGLRLREGLARDGRGGTPEFYFSADSGEEFIAQYFNWVFNNKLLARCDHNGENMKAVEPGSELSFQELIDKKTGLNHQTNFELALGMVWPHIKLAFIRNDENEITGVRYEARACDSGSWRNDSFPLIVAALAMNDDFANKIDSLLLEYGFDKDDGLASLPLYQDSIDASLNYEDRYGTGEVSEFSYRLGQLVDDFFSDKPALHDRLKCFIDVCNSHALPGQTQRQQNPHLADVLAAHSKASSGQETEPYKKTMANHFRRV